MTNDTPHLPAGADSVEAAISTRCSIRAFLPTEVPEALVLRILDIARRAPSGTNMQPWQVTVLRGAALASLGARLEQLALAGHQGKAAYAYYPPTFREPYLSRRRKIGLDLYGLLGIARGEDDKMRRQHARNFRFFDAPVGLIFTIDRDLELGSWLDYGMYLQNVMTLARAYGLDTCAQAAFITFHEEIAAHLGFAEGRALVCGMALGYADPQAPENRLVSERAALADFVEVRDSV